VVPREERALIPTLKNVACARPASNRRALFLCVLAVLLLGQGCISMANVTSGNPIDPKAVKALEPGKSGIDAVLSALGAPLEMHSHPDALLFVYKFRKRKTFNMAISASQLANYLQVTRALAIVLQNLSFTLELIHADEDRLVVIFDRSGKLLGISYRDRTTNLPFF
jgi:outer membrane protein assembly factor BamE (lipoprotein component of BamABCDE complex)